MPYYALKTFHLKHYLSNWDIEKISSLIDRVVANIRYMIGP